MLKTVTKALFAGVATTALLSPVASAQTTLPQIFRSFLSIIGIQIVVLMLILFVPQIMTLFP